ncbi:hypothetical protein Fmac_022419 [Flemingia macrophylla]|uniref:Uncharacterized protein n=1 Tax=Flemingia macrophylla TaxID=520843 RepID=A0ABD1LZM6_9FABA
MVVLSSLRVVSPAKLAGPPSTALKPTRLCWAMGSDNAQRIPYVGPKDLPDSVKIAMEKAKKYKQDKGLAVSQTTQGSERSSGNSGMGNNVGTKGELSVSRMDFAGLDFADKKMTRGLPPGLVPISEPFFDGDLPGVELIVGDTSKFDKATDPEPEHTKEDEAELYKPKVSTWSVFPRPGNISKTFGGGRVIRPGEVLEIEEEKAVKEALKDGDLLMNVGKLKEALPYYEKVMDKLTFQSELHGLAAAVNLSRLPQSNEARSMYEKLQSHPNAKVSKKAREFVYSFQAMEMMKVKTGSPFYLKNSGYQNYFDAFVGINLTTRRKIARFKKVQ